MATRMEKEQPHCGAALPAAMSQEIVASRGRRRQWGRWVGAPLLFGQLEEMIGRPLSDPDDPSNSTSYEPTIVFRSTLIAPNWTGHFSNSYTSIDIDPIILQLYFEIDPFLTLCQLPVSMLDIRRNWYWCITSLKSSCKIRPKIKSCVF